MRLVPRSGRALLLAPLTAAAGEPLADILLLEDVRSVVKGGEVVVLTP